MKEIVQKGDDVLRKIAEEVPVAEISSERIQTIIQEMKESLATQSDGVAIAAPQIGYSVRIFVISNKVFSREPGEIIEDMVFINPQIIKTSRKQEYMEEGCLSVRWWYGKVKRYVKATVKAYDENGDEFTHGGSGLLAQIFQHEIDHLNGILFDDTAKDLREIEESVIKKNNE